MKHVLIGKFSHGRPPIATIRVVFKKLNLKGAVNLSLYDSRHLIIECDLIVDFVRLWLRTTWFLAGFPMRVFKWTPDFDLKQETPLCPVWVSFPGLPLHLFKESALLSVASCIGHPLCIDQLNIDRVQLGCAKICVEFDVTMPQVDEIWVGFAGKTGAYTEGRWQQVVFEHVPSFCKICSHVGHKEGDCKLANRMEVKTNQDKGKGLAKDQDASPKNVPKMALPKIRGRSGGRRSRSRSRITMQWKQKPLVIRDKEAKEAQEGWDAVGGRTALLQKSGVDMDATLVQHVATQSQVMEVAQSVKGKASVTKDTVAKAEQEGWIVAEGRKVQMQAPEPLTVRNRFGKLDGEGVKDGLQAAVGMEMEELLLGPSQSVVPAVKVEPAGVNRGELQVREAVLQATGDDGQSSEGSTSILQSEQKSQIHANKVGAQAEQQAKGQTRATSSKGSAAETSQRPSSMNIDMEAADGLEQPVKECSKDLPVESQYLDLSKIDLMGDYIVPHKHPSAPSSPKGLQLRKRNSVDDVLAGVRRHLETRPSRGKGLQPKRWISSPPDWDPGGDTSDEEELDSLADSMLFW